MRRELKQTFNPLEELLIIIKQYFPKLTSWIDNLTDSRNQFRKKFGGVFSWADIRNGIWKKKLR